MGVVLYVVVAVVVVMMLNHVFLSRWQAERREKRIGARVDAYLETMGREGTPEPLVAMSGAERREVLMSAARRTKIEADRRFYVVTIGGILVLTVAGAFAIENGGVRDFVIALAVGAIAVFGVHTVMQRWFKRKMTAQGIDIERLKIE